MEKTPTVSIIGAGPGDPALISLRGLRALAQADVVIFDHLVHKRLLRHARPGAERIDVGPAAPQPLAQEAICYLLAEKAREGKVVARLKWGDPFVFDRGGEEAIFLHEQGVPFEVIPGIPAAVGVPAYAGIPLTYPGAGDAVVFVRGFESEDGRRPDVDWASLGKIDGTLVCYCGPRQLPAILDVMLSHGWDPACPAALVVNGTTPSQETVSATLGELARQAREPRFREPAMLIVGRVIGLREHLRWFDARPLFGKRVVVTRPREQAVELVELLEGLGASVIEAPAVRIVAPDDFQPLDEAIASVGQYDWIVFTSVNGVDYFLQRLQAGPYDARALAGVKLCAVGPGTAERLAKYWLKVDLMPGEYRAEAVVEALRGEGEIAGRKFLLPRTDIAREVLGDELRRLGAEVTEVTAYRSVAVEPEREHEPDIFRMLLDRKVDVVTFTSASTVRNFCRLYGTDAVADLLRSVAIASIGPVTAEAALQCDIHTSIMPSEYTIPALVRAIVEHFERAPSVAT
ncbi:MAG TPA: uroporphyrinogen-III C-methyltransferase [Vicinamibacterales bacterium]|nr:uroporphyrinogen-III C-methyltransferase [Vicinamibacterales bacterium]